MLSFIRGKHSSRWSVLISVSSLLIILLAHSSVTDGSPTTNVTSGHDSPVAIISHHGSSPLANSTVHHITKNIVHGTMAPSSGHTSLHVVAPSQHHSTATHTVPVTSHTTTTHHTSGQVAAALAAGAAAAAAEQKSTSKPAHATIVVTETPAPHANSEESVVKTPISHTVSHLNGNKTITTTTYKVVSGGHHSGNQTSHLISPIHSAAVAAAVAGATHPTTSHPITVTSSSTVAPVTTTTTTPIKSVTVHSPTPAAHHSAISGKFAFVCSDYDTSTLCR